MTSYILEEIVSDQNFNEAKYLLANPDVARAVSSGQMLSGRQHFEYFGRKEGRKQSRSNWNKMAKFHFVEDYEAPVKNLLATKPLDQAMSEAVGGSYHLIGDIERSIVIYAGLKDGMKLIDYGCGSGRLANSLAMRLKVDYLGIDIIDDLLKYARLKSPKEYVFLKHQELNVPADSNSADMICAFSLFTHLLQAETYIYMEDMYRVLKPRGKLVFSFLEFDVPSQWCIFDGTIKQHKANIANNVPLTMFMEKNVIQCWANHIGFKVMEFINGDVPHFEGRALGQSVAILGK